MNTTLNDVRTTGRQRRAVWHGLKPGLRLPFQLQRIIILWPLLDYTVC